MLEPGKKETSQRSISDRGESVNERKGFVMYRYSLNKARTWKKSKNEGQC